MKIRLLLIICAVVFVCLLAGTALLAADQWPMFHRDNTRTGSDHGILPLAQLGAGRPIPIWVFPSYSPPIDPIDDDSADATKFAKTASVSLPWRFWRGDWASGVSYAVNDAVTFGGMSYVCKVAVSGTMTPNLDAADWTAIPTAQAPGANNSDYHSVTSVYKATPEWDSFTDAKAATATWTFNLTDSGQTATYPGSYYIYIFFPTRQETDVFRSTDAHFIVKVGGTVVGTFTVDQTSGGVWVNLSSSPITAQFGLSGDTVTVELTNETQDSNHPEQHIVIADAVKLVSNTGQVLASPVIAERSGGGTQILVSPVSENRPLPLVFGQDSARDVGVVYGINTETPASPAPDVRGLKAWSFPSNPNNWVSGLISSSPIITTLGADEVAVFGAGDGQVYVVKTSDGSLVWQGPGYTIDETDSSKVASTGTWSAGANAGYQGSGYSVIQATKSFADGSQPPKASVTYTPGITTPGTYSIYAWVPPASVAENHIHDALYRIDYTGKLPDRVIDNSFGSSVVPGFQKTGTWTDGPASSPGYNGNYIYMHTVLESPAQWETYVGPYASWTLTTPDAEAGYAVYVYIPATGSDPGFSRSTDAHYILQVIRASNIGGTLRGPWASGSVYSLQNVVSYNGSTYICILATSSSDTTAPDADTTHWRLREEVHGHFTIDQKNDNAGKWVMLGNSAIVVQHGDLLTAKLATETQGSSPDVVIADAAKFVRQGVVDQRNGGRWASLGMFNFSTGAIASSLTITLQNDTSSVPAGTPVPSNLVVAADAIRVVPSDLGVFNMSSPLVLTDATHSVTGTTIVIGDTTQMPTVPTSDTFGGRVYGLKTDSQDPAWVFPSIGQTTYANPVGAFYASPTLNNPDPTAADTIYIGSADGHVYALNTDGTQKWVYPLKTVDSDGTLYTLGSITSTSVVGMDGDTLYVPVGADAGTHGFMFAPGGTSGGTGGRIVALNTASGSGRGRERWWFPSAPLMGGSQTLDDAVGSFMYSTPMLMDVAGTPTLTIGSTDQKVYSINPTTGVASSGYTASPMGGNVLSSPAGISTNYQDLKNAAPAGDVAFVGSGTNGGGRLNGIKLTNGFEDWFQDLKGAVISSPALYNKRIYVGDMGGYTWAFSTRMIDSTTQEGWNSSTGMQPNTSNSESKGRPSTMDFDFFTQKNYDLIVTNGFKAGKTLDQIPGMPAGGTLHDLAAGKTITDPHYKAGAANKDGSKNWIYEWGERLYLIAWGLFDPLDGSGQSTSTVSVTVAAQDPGTGLSNNTDVRNMTQSGYFVPTSGGSNVYYATLAYDFGSNSVAASNKAVITAVETPKATGTTAADQTSPVLSLSARNPGNPSLCPWQVAGVTIPQPFTVNNPLAIGVCVDPVAQTYTVLGTDNEAGKTQWNTAHAGANGNDGVVLPLSDPALNSHGTASQQLWFEVADRSLTGLQSGATPLRVKSQPTTIAYQFDGTSAIPGFLQGEQVPGVTVTGEINTSADYPDIPATKVSVLAADSGTDLLKEGVDLLSAPAASSTPLDLSSATATWNAPWKKGVISTSIPRFQPSRQYTGSVFFYIDSPNGSFNPGTALGAQQLSNAAISGRPADPFRQFTYTVGVGEDKRVDITDQSLDLGEVPQGFGLFPRFASGGVLDNNGIPGLFSTSLLYDPSPSTMANKIQPVKGVNVLAPGDLSDTTAMWRYAPTYAPWFRPFSAYNVGNENLPQVMAVRSSLGSDTVLGQYEIPNSFMKTTLDDEYNSKDAYNWSGFPVYNYNRTFHKARVGEDAPQLKVVDFLPHAADLSLQFPGTRTPIGEQTLIAQPPAVGVGIPIGQPVGTYSGKFYLADGTTALSNTVDVKVTVTEAKITNDYEKGHIPALDPLFYPSSPQSPVKLLSGNGSPAAFRDPFTGDIFMAMSSNRTAWTDATAYRTPLSTDPWYLYLSKLTWAFPASSDTLWSPYSFGTGLIVPFDPNGAANATSLTTWAETTNQPNSDNTFKAFAYPIRADLNPSVNNAANDARSYFPSSLLPTDPNYATDPLGPKSVIPSSIQFANPWFAPYYDSAGNRQVWMFYSGQATKNPAINAPGNLTKKTEYRGYYTKLSSSSSDPVSLVGSGGGLKPAYLTTDDSTMPKLGFKGAATPISGSTAPWLWSYWYGGNSNRWNIYYNANTLPNHANSSTGAPDKWTSPAQLTVPKDLVSAAEPSMVYRQTIGDGNNIQSNVVEMVYSGYSTLRKNSDIYLTRYQVGGEITKDNNSYMSLNTMTLPMRSGGLWMYPTGPGTWTTGSYGNGAKQYSNLSREASSTVWNAAEVDWDWDPNAKYDPAKPPFNVVVFTGAAGLEVTVGTPVRDSKSGALAYTYEEKNANTGNYLYPNQRRLFRGAVVNPGAGSVKFMVAPTSNSIVAGYFRPKAYLLTKEFVPDVSPCAILDTSANLKYGPNDFYGTGTTRTDRMWLFWRRPSVDPKQGTGIFYKTFRHAITLKNQIPNANQNTAVLSKPASGTAIVSINPAGTSTALSTPVEVDWIRGRLYFMAEEEGKTFDITYIAGNGATYTDRGVVHMQEETGSGATDQYQRENPGQPIPAGLASQIGNVTRQSINEGQICAFIDPTYSVTPTVTNGAPSPPKVWVFWSSSRSGTTDIYYETISPNF